MAGPSWEVPEDASGDMSDEVVGSAVTLGCLLEHMRKDRPAGYERDGPEWLQCTRTGG